MINIELCWFSTIFTTQFEFEFFPSVVLGDLVFLRIKEIKMRRPPGGVWAHVSISILHLVETEAILGHFGPLTKI